MSVVPFHQPHPPGCTCQMCCQIDSDTIRCWQQMQLFEQMISDIVNKIFANPTPEMITAITNMFNTNVIPSVGVTDGSNAKPGHVGELLHFYVPAIPFTAAQQLQVIPVGIIPPGDWQIQIEAGVQSGAMGSLSGQLDTLPVGFTHYLQTYFQIDITPGTAGEILATSLWAKANVTVPTPMNYRVTTNFFQTGTAGTFALAAEARRMR